MFTEPQKKEKELLCVSGSTGFGPNFNIIIPISEKLSIKFYSLDVTENFTRVNNGGMFEYKPFVLEDSKIALTRKAIYSGFLRKTYLEDIYGPMKKIMLKHIKLLREECGLDIEGTKTAETDLK